LKQFFKIESHVGHLRTLGLDTMAGVKAWSGGLIKNQRGRRDVSRIEVADSDGVVRVLYLKRTWQPYRKDGVSSLFRYGRVVSSSRREWNNYIALTSAGVDTPELIAHGEECGPFWERFSFILTGEVRDSVSLDQFLGQCREPRLRRNALREAALTVGKMHMAGLFSPDLFSRHIFVSSQSPRKPEACLIDMARLDRCSRMMRKKVVRDLALLNVSTSLHLLSLLERRVFIRTHPMCENGQWLLRAVEKKSRYYLRKRKKFRGCFNLPETSLCEDQ
jgi:tRNA A-37 threonylcarbamoyl transferase component Bud32